ncbi:MULTISPECIES: SPFH domain-containing protein [unclassified Streptomyces]|uniref:SPFH domain-containing protein n=1 Tax=unclassified Streptomyces TaxID=2593676 RepID=UPI000DBA01FB|nr:MULTISPECIES: SPFH domain-containing protein [unclassified Streptomyces]MYT68837.1 SPFH domain-containing protein [Streptomyces sp. SID8367]RAJ86511.1 regulator of protease activity HflC (stomatin/prohibitin superfamily) [Streptomyces sp. PsTaAH-137]
MPETDATPDVPQMPRTGVREFTATSIGGGLALLLGLVGLVVGAGLVAVGAGLDSNGAKAVLIAVGIVLAIAAVFAMCGLNMVAPGEARVVQLFGRYRGTIRTDGLRWVNPLTSRTKISTRVRNHETAVLKVNDAYGNPIELAAVVVWKVEDTAQATFEVDDFLEFVSTQTEAAVRHIAIEYPYDAHDEGGLSLRGNAEEITEKLAVELHARVEAAGVQIIESRFTHLAYAPEIASAMLQRQQAGAVVAARRQIVDGAVGMVEAALARISEQDIVELDEERKAAMVSNLLVVLCGDRAAQPVLNTGTLYQ